MFGCDNRIKTVKQGVFLAEISYYRPILILCILIGHCFAIYSGAWERPNNIEYIEVYKYVNPVFISFQLAAFAFVSGYLAALHSDTIHGKKFLLKKFKRLYLPSLIFSFVYYFLFKFQDESYSLVKSVVYILSGAGHLWFLPMLFWCFVALLVVNKFLKKSIVSILSIIIFIFICPIPFVKSIPFGIGKALYYFPFFYLGYRVLKRRSFFQTNNRIWLCTAIVYIILMISKLYIRNVFLSENGYIVSVLNQIFDFSLLVSGTLMGFAIFERFTKNVTKLSPCIIYANRYSYAVYVVHQFILLWLVYHCASLYANINAYILPFVWIFITLLLSLLVGSIILKTRFGRMMLG